jgi:hypothetical protein
VGAHRRVRRQRNLSVTADIYTHVLFDETELDYARLLAESA